MRTINLIAIAIGLAAIALPVAYHSLLGSGVLINLLIPIVVPIIVSFWLPTRWFWAWLACEVAACSLVLMHLQSSGDQAAYEFTMMAIYINLPFTIARLFTAFVETGESGGYR